MQHDIRAEVTGKVTTVIASAGAQVADGALLIEIEMDKD